MSNAIQTVAYPNLGWETAADIYFPPGFDKSRKYPAIVAMKSVLILRRPVSRLGKDRRRSAGDW